MQGVCLQLLIKLSFFSSCDECLEKIRELLDRLRDIWQNLPAGDLQDKVFDQIWELEQRYAELKRSEYQNQVP